MARPSMRFSSDLVSELPNERDHDPLDMQVGDRNEIGIVWILRLEVRQDLA